MSLMVKTSFPPREFVGIAEPGQTSPPRGSDFENFYYLKKFTMMALCVFRRSVISSMYMRKGRPLAEPTLLLGATWPFTICQRFGGRAADGSADGLAVSMVDE
jgi:hypothetical protein